MKNYKEENMKIFEEVVTSDSFKNEYQNDDIYEGGVSGENILIDFFNRNKYGSSILDLGCGDGTLLEALPEINFAIDPHPERVQKVANKYQDKEVAKGWCENIPYLDKTFTTVILWGTFCFVRSQAEAFVEINRVLDKNGIFILDVCRETNLSIAQTVHVDSFINWARTFGFSLVEKRDFSSNISHLRTALAFKKFEQFDFRRLRLPQCIGEINNYLEKRDWYLR
jgi:ubiquinone/menaquinone biosynthesis C-methylase UbiE